MNRSQPAHASSLAERGEHCATIGDYIEFRALVAPGAPVIFRNDGSRLVNRQLLDYVQQFGEVMKSNSLSASSRIAILVENGLEAAVAVLVVMAKAIAVPLSPQLTANELFSVLRETNVDALLIDSGTSSSLLRTLQQHDIPLIYIHSESANADAIFTSMSRESQLSTCLNTVKLPTDLCMILQTSGTTAKPKRVPFTEKRILGIAEAYACAFALGDDDCCLNPMSLQHTHGIFALFAALVSGGSIVCTADAYPATIIDRLQGLPVSWLTAVPTVLQALVNDPALTHSFAKKLRFIRSSAAHLAGATVKQLEDRFATSVYETYGLTEISFAAISYSDNRRIGSIGRPAPHIEIQILDHDKKPCSPSISGEIALKSEYITPEYLDDNTATVAAFHQGWFLTGDEGYVDVDGYIYLTGRLKEVINRAGENISPNEIDEILMNHPQVAQAVSFGVLHPQMGERVVSAVVLRKQADLTENQIKHFAGKFLAPFKIPSQVIFVVKIPTGKTGKIQRRFLPEYFRREIDCATRADFILPTTPHEVFVAQTFATIFQIDRISQRDDFFHLGGNSLQAARVCAELSKHFGMDVNPSLLLRYSTVQDLAQQILYLGGSAGEARPNDSFMVFNAHYSGTPLIFFHQDFDFGGLYTRRFAQGLQRPVIVVDPILPPEIYAKRSIESFAAYYSSWIKHYYPQGPYALGGFCAGGTVAYEMARCFALQGDQVEWLILLNTVAKNHRFAWLDSLCSFMSGKNAQRKNAWFLRLRRALTGSHGVNAIQWLAHLRAVVQCVRHTLVKPSPEVESASSPPGLHDLDWMEYHLANVAYCPKPSPVSMLLFVCDETPPDKQYGWEKYVRNICKKYLPGRQDDLISTHSEHVVRTIESTLAGG